MTSDPPRSIANMAGTVEAAEGYPAVRKVTKALWEVRLLLVIVIDEQIVCEIECLRFALRRANQ